MTLTLGAACGGDRAVAPAAVPSVSTADLPPGTIRREFTPPEQLGLWTRADSLTAQQGMERARRQAAHVTAAQRRALLAHPLLDDYPVLRVAMTATSEADVNRVLLPALRRLVTVSSLDRSGEAAAGTPRGVRYSYRGQALLSVRFADARRMKVSVEGTPHGDALAVAGAMGTVAAESGTISLEDMALLLAGITAMEMDVAELLARNERALARLSRGALASLQSGGGAPGLGCQRGWSTIHASHSSAPATEGVSFSVSADQDCFDMRIRAGLEVAGGYFLIKELGSAGSSFFARAITTGATRLAAAAAGMYVLGAMAAAATAYVAYAAITCSADEVTFRGPAETQSARASMLRFSLAPAPPPYMSRT